jgi:hypothetical protein
MDSFIIRHVLLFASILTFSTAAAQGSCNACNCQFGNMDVIDTYIEAIVDARLAAAATSQRNDTGMHSAIYLNSYTHCVKNTASPFRIE